MTEILLVDLLTRIQHKNFSDPKQISEELGRLIIRDNLTAEEFGYISSQIFNSNLNLFSFLTENATDKEKKIVALRRECFTVMSDYVSVARGYLTNYLTQLKNSTMLIFRKETSDAVKEAALKFLLKIIQTYDKDVLIRVLEIQALASTLLDERKLMRPKPPIKGRIWQILGELIRKFPEEMKLYCVEIQEISFYDIKNMMELKTKMELKALKGLLELTRHILASFNYTPDEMKNLYIFAISGIQKIPDVSTYDVSFL